MPAITAKLSTLVLPNGRHQATLCDLELFTGARRPVGQAIPGYNQEACQYMAHRTTGRLSSRLRLGVDIFVLLDQETLARLLVPAADCPNPEAAMSHLREKHQIDRAKRGILGFMRNLAAPELHHGMECLGGSVEEILPKCQRDYSQSRRSGVGRAVVLSTQFHS